jgi:hypothetical protein
VADSLRRLRTRPGWLSTESIDSLPRPKTDISNRSASSGQTILGGAVGVGSEVIVPRDGASGMNLPRSAVATELHPPQVRAARLRMRTIHQGAGPPKGVAFDKGRLSKGISIPGAVPYAMGSPSTTPPGSFRWIATGNGLWMVRLMTVPLTLVIFSVIAAQWYSVQFGSGGTALTAWIELLAMASVLLAISGAVLPQTIPSTRRLGFDGGDVVVDNGLSRVRFPRRSASLDAKMVLHLPGRRLAVTREQVDGFWGR